MKRIRSVAFVLCAVLCAFTTYQAASAGPDDVTCGSFSNDQPAAQAYFDANGQPAALDGDGDGQACASPEDGDYTGGPSAGPSGPSAGPEDVTCGHFNNDQAAAQAYFEANDHPYNLDGDGDGQACASPEDGDYTSTGPSAGPEEGSGSTDPTTNAGAGDATSAAPESAVVSELPVTGSGVGLPSHASGEIALLLAASLMLAAGACARDYRVRR